MVNDRSASAQIKKNTRAEEWLKSAVKDKHVRLIPFSEISKVKYNVAKGGSGTIHLGAWRNMHVAIKEQHNTNDLIKELKMHKQVHDSNYIVKFFGITKHPLTHDTCIVMQFAENGCLQDFLETQNISITWLTKYRLAWEIASGLDFIHRENIFHTDLHSRNILIDTGGKALITDFGLSKSVNKTIYTTKAGLFGVVPYVAPERMQNPTITYNAKCDIYSLGVIFWELSSCVIPFEAQLQDVMLAVNIIAGVREKTVPGTAVEYEMLYRRCWDGLPQNRPQMDIVLSELVELLASEQVNPRPAAPRPSSPRPARPLSSDSMVAPSIYDNESTLQSSLENTDHMQSASPPSLAMRPGARQSFGQGMVPLVQQTIPSVPIRQDRSGVRVSFLGESLVKDNSANGMNRLSFIGQADTGRNSQARSPNKANSNDAEATNGSYSNPPPGHDYPTIHDISSSASNSDAINPAMERSMDNAHGQDQSPSRTNTDEDNEALSLPATLAADSTEDASEWGLQLLPPLPAFNSLSFSPNTPPPKEQSMAKLPETAALALSNGLSMVSVVSKLNMASIRNIPTISPPPPGAPPPPPGPVAGHSNSPRVISPPSAHRPRVVSPPKMRNNQVPRASKTISPPVGPPPPRVIPSPSLGPIPKPPPGPPPTPTLAPTVNGAGAGAGAAASTNGPTSRNPAAPVFYTPTTSYSPHKGKTAVDKDKTVAANEESEGSSLSEAARPTPARQIPMGFPVVTPLSPPHWSQKPTSFATEQTPNSHPSSTPASEESSPSGSPSSANSTAPSSTSTSPSTNRRDFRPISFLTQQKHSGLIDLADRVEQELQQQQQQNRMRKQAENVYVPNPSNNIIPPSQLFMQRAQSPDLIRRDGKDSRALGSPSLRSAQSPAAAAAENANGNPDHRVVRSPLIKPSDGRSASPAPSFTPHSSGAVSSSSTRVHNAIMMRSSEEEQALAEVRSIAVMCDQRPQLQPSKESTSSIASSISSSTTVTNSTTIINSTKPRVQFDNFYSLSDPYKELKHDEPTDFFTAVTQSDKATIERMLKSFPHLIHDSSGFWPHPTPILVAARSRNALETIKILARHGAALDRGDHNGTTVLHFICEQYPNPLETVQFLIRSGADSNSRDAKKRTPLMVLLQNNRIVSTKVLLETMRALFKYGAQAKTMDHQFQRTPLHYAILHCKEPAPVMELLLKKGADVNARDWRKLTPLHVVLEKMDNEEIVQMLLLYGADPGLRNGSKRNALGVAAENLRVMSAWFLLENDLLSSAPDSIKKASELCSKADGPDKSAKPLFKNTLSDWQGKEGKQRRIQLAHDCVLRVQRTPDMKTINQTQMALEFLESVGQPIHMANINNNASNLSVGGSGSNISPTSSTHSHSYKSSNAALSAVSGYYEV
ncbi:hypothetical protein BG011_000164 [Mortierella polycephala]|uniref:Protein kinase domain-containing protein n=1 Tax=Mortierella polycephala TaxID=41804 RepID=A0A9P6Q9C5_9FUNG|nr:hypothetical protein BG011_000164 [Mortierella polycephala]